MSSAKQPAYIGRASQAKFKFGVKKGLMNQAAISRSRPVPTAMHRSMVVPSGEYLRNLASWGAEFSDFGAPTLENDA